MNNSVFMVISHIQRPAAGVNMSVKGNSANPDNWETFENMALVDKVNKKALYSSSVIIDLLGGKVVKNRFDVSDSDTFREYVDRYQDDVTDALKTWGRKSPLNYAKLKTVSQAAHAALDAKKETNDDTIG
jgi:hypothetical protein